MTIPLILLIFKISIGENMANFINSKGFDFMDIALQT